MDVLLNFIVFDLTFCALSGSIVFVVLVLLAVFFLRVSVRLWSHLCYSHFFLDIDFLGIFLHSLDGFSPEFVLLINNY